MDIKNLNDVNIDNKELLDNNFILKHKVFWKKIKVLSNTTFENNDIFTKISSIMEWLSWRDIKKIVDIAFNKSIIDEKEIDFNMLWEAIEEFIIWKDKDIKISDDELKRIAYHEMWHAIIGKMFWKRIIKIWISTKNMSLWQTFSIDDNNKILKNREDMIIEVLQLLAWRAAEKIYLGNISSWSQNDYERVTKVLIQYLLLNFSFNYNGKKISLWYVVQNIDEISELEKNKIYKYIKNIIFYLESIVEKILLENNDEIEKYTKILLKDKIIMEDEFLFNNIKEISDYIILE